MDLIQLPSSSDGGNRDNRASHVAQEATVVLKDIFRKYPNKYEGVIATLCENLDALDEPEARVAIQ